MKNNDNIEKLFKKTFEHFEADVNPQVWTNVQNRIESATGGTGVSSPAFTLGKIIAGVASVTILIGSIWYFSSSKNNTGNIPVKLRPVENSLKEKATNSNHTAEHVFSDTVFTAYTNGQISPVIPSINHGSSGPPVESRQTGIVSGTLNTETTTKGSFSENTEHTSAPPIPHKYGKNSEGLASPIHENQTQNPKPKQPEENTVRENQEAEQTPNATILASAESGDVPLTVNFTSQGIFTSVSWDFGDGSSSRETSPLHTFHKPGNYAVTLASKNSMGSSTNKITIEVKSISGILNTPNIFSPNGDGENDLFFLGLKNIASIEVIISDLNAHVVARWSTLEGSWNGKLKNGDDAPEGLYFYTIQAIGTDGVNHSHKGSVSLIRTH